MQPSKVQMAFTILTSTIKYRDVRTLPYSQLVKKNKNHRKPQTYLRQQNTHTNIIQNNNKS